MESGAPRPPHSSSWREFADSTQKKPSGSWFNQSQQKVAGMNDRQTDWLQSKPPAVEAREPVLAEVIRKPTILHAITYAQECAGLEEKQVYSRLGWSKEVWSRIFNPDAKNPVFFDVRRLGPFMDLTNDAPLMWLAHHRGHDWSTIRPYQNDLEREVFELRQKLAEKDRELAIAAQLISGRVPR